MGKRILHIICPWFLVITSFQAYGQYDVNAIMNYEPMVFKSGSVIYSVCKDSEGILYFGTSGGILIYDGESFETVRFDDDAEGRIVEYDPITNRIYAGATAEFGYLEKDTSITYNYVSLSQDIFKEHPFNDVWQIMPKDNSVFFQTYEGIYQWDGTSTQYLQIIDSFIFDGDSAIYLSKWGGPLYQVIQNDTFELYDQSVFEGEFLYQILPFDDEYMILASSTFGLFLLNRNNLKVKPFESSANEFFKEKYFYQASRLDSNIYVAGTWEGGLAIFNNLTGDILHEFNQEAGLISNAIYDQELDHLGNLWAVGEYGISRINLNRLTPDLFTVDKRPQTLIRSVQLDLDSAINPVSISNPVFKNDVGTISFSFATPGFDYYGDNYYSYTLEGKDETWTNWSTENVVNYPGLKNGKYTFRVKSRIKGNEESQIASYSFEVRTPWYLWFRINYVYLFSGLGLFSGALFGLTYRHSKTRKSLARKVELRTREIAEQKDVLERVNNHLMELNNELDSFIYRSSHDLIAPIKSVKGLISIFRISESSTERSKYIQLMDDQLTKLEEFISEINSYTKNEKREVHKSEFNFKDLVISTQKDLSYFKNAQKIDFQICIDDGMIVVSDKERWEMIISNLITNSIKYHNQFLEDPYIKIVASRQNGNFELFVEDNGQGIKEDHLPKIFDMFYRANSGSEGSGLGLYLVKKTLEKLNGSISISSEYGNGTKVDIKVDGN